MELLSIKVILIHIFFENAYYVYFQVFRFLKMLLLCCTLDKSFIIAPNDLD